MKIANTLGNHLRKNPLISPLIFKVVKVSSASFAILGIIINANEGIIATFAGIFILSKLLVKSDGLTIEKNNEKPRPPIKTLINILYIKIHPLKKYVNNPKTTIIGRRAHKMLKAPRMFLKMIFSRIMNISRSVNTQFLFKIRKPNCIEIISTPTKGLI